MPWAAICWTLPFGSSSGSHTIRSINKATSREGGIIQYSHDQADSMAEPNALQLYRRSTGDRYIAGVCGGLGEVTPVPSWAWRVLLVVTAPLAGIGVLLY